MRNLFPALVAGAALLGGCASYTKDMGKATTGPVAIASLRTATGADVGRATARQTKGGLRLTVDVMGMPPGEHGAHIHAVGRCDPTDFMTAGGHWNPAATKHGLMNPAGPHEGDLPNLIVGNDGHGTLGVTIKGATMAGLLDSDGSAMIVHAARDDQVSDPSGNSGARIACGVFALN
ncbi:superoxide dismutase family protein [Sphingomonas sp.]|uniref:superoxide dismutase family protein n=1 Tax=Sphingomonas sp. TaxID=28214 RepID=UPI001DCC6129|nr:superoxide dismutase family protein [Sphingomonas sp.]MBX9796041.1 superoxide dismutase family protein [Sphingomonas sp.]